MYTVRSYDDNDNQIIYNQSQIQRAEKQEHIIEFLKQFYQVVVPVICALLATIKFGFAIRLFYRIITKSKWWVKRDWQVKLGPALNPIHLALLDLLSSGLFCIIPLWVFLLRRRITRSFLIKNIATVSSLALFMLFFTSFVGSLWLFGINIIIYSCFFIIDYILQNYFNVQLMLNNSYSV